MTCYQTQTTEKQTSIDIFYVYLHTRLSDGVVFYVGLGSKKRAWVKDARCASWRDTVAQHGYTVSFVGRDLTLEDARALEVDTIAHYRKISGDCLCNITNGGEGRLGVPHTEETKVKIGAATKGKKRTPEQKLKISLSTKGRKLSLEHKEKIAAYRTGRPRTEATKAKLREAHTGKKMSDLAIANMREAKKKMTPETREKMSESAKTRPPVSSVTREKLSVLSKGRKHTAEAKARMSEAQKLVVKDPSIYEHLKTVNIGRTLSDETKMKISASSKGRKISDETRAKMCIAAKKRMTAHRLGLDSISKLAQLEDKSDDDGS